MKLWICGQYRSGEPPIVVWDFQGIFSSEELARAACRSAAYFIAPVDLDGDLPDAASEMPGAYYPLA